MREFLQILMTVYFAMTIFVFVAMNLAYVFLLLRSSRRIIDYVRRARLVDYRRMVQSEVTPPVSILAPAFNEEQTIIESVKSLLKLTYGVYEVVVINDGSTDGTMSRMTKMFDLVPSSRAYRERIPSRPVRGVYRSRLAAYANLVVLDKENGGKADSLNAGINLAAHEYVCCIDSDSILEDNALQIVMRIFLEDDTVVAAGGIVRVANGCAVVNGRVTNIKVSKKILPQFQVVEYFRAFLSGRMGWESLNALLIISGAFGIFRRSVLLAVGGYNPRTVGEDMELVVRIHRYHTDNNIPYRVVFAPDPVCWTEVPESTRVLARQRNRWQRGLMEVMKIHGEMLFNEKYGVVGLAALPYYMFIELLGPVIELLGYVSLVALYAMGILSAPMAVLFFIVSLVFGVMLSVGAVILEEISFSRYPRAADLAQLIAVGIIENFGYRQLTLLWRIRGIIDYMRKKTAWGTMDRAGFGRKGG